MVMRSWFSMGASFPTLQVLSVMGSPMTSTDQVWDRPTLMVAVRRLSRTSRGLTEKYRKLKLSIFDRKDFFLQDFADLRTIYLEHTEQKNKVQKGFIDKRCLKKKQENEKHETDGQKK
jgi:hypothetical protein